MLKTINMKTIRKITGLAILILFIAPLSLVMAQNGPGDPPGGAGSGDHPVGGNAPIGGGIFLLTTLGLAYGGKKVYDARRKAGK